MQSSLGVYIDKHIIKYAKMHQDKNDIQIESCNTKIYDGHDIKEVIKQIINETSSEKIPVGVNVNEELYNMFHVPTVLSIKDAKRAADIECETFCSEKNINKMSYSIKSLFVDDRVDTENQRVLNVFGLNSEISKLPSLFPSGNRISTITPISSSISNLLEETTNENVVVVNIEEKTYVTTVIDGEIYQFDTINQGMGDILAYITTIENSYAKAYEVCKNVTVYSQEVAGSYEGEAEYTDVIKTKLYEIATQVKQIVDNSFSNVNKVYITGSATCINNIDLFFQEVIGASPCELLRPYFLKDATTTIPIKEYIENNSAIAVGLDALGFVNKEMNFSKGGGNFSFSFDIKFPKKSGDGASKENKNALTLTNLDLSAIKQKLGPIGEKIVDDFKQPIGSVEKLFIRASVICLLIMIIFAMFSNTISNQISSKTAEVESTIKEDNAELGKLKSDISTISASTSSYKSLIQEMTAPVEEDTTDETGTTEKKITIAKDSIPNLLNRLMFVIPKKVKLLSIENTTAKHIVIQAQAEKYEQLGYFKAVISTNQILTNVKSTSAEKTGNDVQVTIEGDLP